MCGIAGIYSKHHKINATYIQTMTDALKHRGPDDEGFLAVNTKDSNIFELTGEDSVVSYDRIENFKENTDLILGHRRLSIIDLSPSGHQPMFNKDKTIAVIYNGEIFNYIELKEELRKLGHTFTSNSDTEVLVEAYSEWGENCLEKFNGMWAFVIYDKRKNVLFGARDRFGVKPFYYINNTDYFVFASEIKALTKLPFIPSKINDKAVFDYLTSGLIESEEEGFLKGIYELKPSHSFVFNLLNSEFTKKKYYSLKYTDKWEQYEHVKSKEYIWDVQQKIFSAINLRLRSDVTVGSCLSGGLDSSAIVCVINESINKNPITQIGDTQKVFTASYEEKNIDESKWAKLVVDKTKTQWLQTFPKPNELIDDLEELVYYQDIPFGSTSIYAQYRVMRLAKENGVSVLLDGQGGDELFTGYTYFYNYFFQEILKHFSASTLLTELKYLKNSPTHFSEIFSALLKSKTKKLLPSVLTAKIISKRAFENKYINNDLIDKYNQRFLEIKKSDPINLNHALYRQFTQSGLRNLLRYEDRNSMRFSIESRTPFADDINLIDYVFKIPSVYKIHRGWSKYLLRESMKGIVPNEIIYRTDKIGFTTPEYSWLVSLKDQLREYLTDSLGEYIEVKKLINDWGAILNAQSKMGITNIWRFINFAFWKKIYKL